jgi:flavin reductase (DIM6/NTAB) family NADH-FMN oxidoreductase RutF
MLMENISQTVDFANPGLTQPGLNALFQRAAGFIPTAVAVLCSESVTMTVSSLCCVSWEPPFVSVSLHRNSRKAAALITRGGFRARLLRAEEKQFAQHGKIPIDRAGLLELECEIRNLHPAGDHQLVLAEVIRIHYSDGLPLLYWRRGFHSFRPKYQFLVSREAFAEFVSAFEGGCLGVDQWNHAAHVDVAVYYAVRYRDTSLENTRCGIIRHNQTAGTANTPSSGYHETLTCLWAAILSKMVEGFEDPWEATRFAVEKVGEDRDLHHLYYSFDVVNDPVARQIWVAPDLEGPYPFSNDIWNK